MAKRRTVSAGKLTDFDRKWLTIAEAIAQKLEGLIQNQDKRIEFHVGWSKVSFTRDAGTGKGGGKLQRDALCTRGRTDKAPFSNRNLRWHPLIIAHETPDWAIQIQKIEIDVDGRRVYFVIDNECYPATEVHTLRSYQPIGDILGDPHITTNKPFCAPLVLWKDHANVLRCWSDDDWTNNSCAIPAAEYSPAEYCIEVFALLAIAILDNFYNVSCETAMQAVLEVFREQNYEPTHQFAEVLNSIDDMLVCPLCKAKLNDQPARISPRDRPQVFQPPWRSPKREEGAPESIQLFHVEPLIETEIRHTPKLTRYGHRWCNVAMADRSLEETLDFMEAVVRVHRGSIASMPDKSSNFSDLK